MQDYKFKVGMRVKYKSKVFIQTMPKRYRELSVAKDAMNHNDISDFVITQIHYSRLFDDEQSNIVRIRSTKHQKDYNTLVAFLRPYVPKIMEGDRL